MGFAMLDQSPGGPAPHVTPRKQRDGRSACLSFVPGVIIHLRSIATRRLAAEAVEAGRR